MQPRGFAAALFDNVFHALWQMCAVVGAFTIPWVPNRLSDFRPIGASLAAGLIIGLLTMPAVLRIIRPPLERRFPWAFGD